MFLSQSSKWPPYASASHRRPLRWNVRNSLTELCFSGGAAKAFVPMKTPAALQKELDAALKRIEVLEGRLKKAGLDAS